MSKQIQDAYIVAATRLPVGRRKGMLGHVRPDDMLAHAISLGAGAGAGNRPVQWSKT
jgi:acetyl-CoA acyltransferase